MSEFSGAGQNGAQDSQASPHSGVDSSGAVTGPEGPEATQSGVHGAVEAFNPATLTPDALSTASPEVFAERMDPAFPGLRSALEMRWGGEYAQRLGAVHALGSAMLESMGAQKYYDFTGKLAATGVFHDPRFWDGLSRMSPAEAMSRAGTMTEPVKQQKGPSVPGTGEDIRGTLDELRSRQRDLARSGPIGSVRAQALQPEIDALDRQVNGNGPIIGKQGRSA